MWVLCVCILLLLSTVLLLWPCLHVDGEARAWRYQRECEGGGSSIRSV